MMSLTSATQGKDQCKLTVKIVVEAVAVAVGHRWPQRRVEHDQVICLLSLRHHVELERVVQDARNLQYVVRGRAVCTAPHAPPPTLPTLADTPTATPTATP